MTYNAFDEIVRAMVRALTLGEAYEVLRAVGVPMNAYPPETSFRERLYREVLSRANV